MKHCRGVEKQLGNSVWMSTLLKWFSRKKCGALIVSSFWSSQFRYQPSFIHISSPIPDGCDPLFYLHLSQPFFSVIQTISAEHINNASVKRVIHVSRYTELTHDQAICYFALLFFLTPSRIPVLRQKVDVCVSQSTAFCTWKRKDPYRRLSFSNRLLYVKLFR